MLWWTMGGAAQKLTVWRNVGYAEIQKSDCQALPVGGMQRAGGEQSAAALSGIRNMPGRTTV